jgi:hypothetical protein
VKHITIDFRKGYFFLSPMAQTTAGIWMGTDPRQKLPAECTDAELGSAIRASLDRSKLGVPHPKVWTGLMQPLLELAGVNSWAAFVRGSSCVLVEEEDEKIVNIPTVNMGAAEGFTPNADRSVVVASGADVADIGAAAREAFRRSTPPS